MSRDDIHQEACLLLCYAARRYNPEKLDSFRIYAWMRLRSLHVDLLRQQYGRDDNPDPSRRIQLLSLDAPMDGGDGETYLAFFENHGAEAGFRQRVENSLYLDHLMQPLNPRYQQIFMAFREGKLKSEVAAELGVNFSRVSQIYSAGLETIRKAAGIESLPVAA